MRVFTFLARLLTAPWRAYTEYQLTKLRLQVEAQTAPMKAMAEMVREMADSQRGTATVLQTWLDGFRVHEVPSSSTVRDEDEAAAERARNGVDSPGVSLPGLTPAQAQALLSDFVEFDQP
jgi:hypothetical protein